MGDDFRARQGCDGEGSRPVAMLPDGTPLYECPGRLVTRTTVRACESFSHVEPGRPIGATCAIDESATLVAALRIIGAEVSARRTEEMNRGR